MKKNLAILLTCFSLCAFAQRKDQLYISSDVYQHTQADVDAFYKGYCETAKTAWDYYYKGDYKTAIYYADRVSTSIIDGDYLYTQKTQILCLSYARLGDKRKALQFYKKVKKKSPPDAIKAIEQTLGSLGVIDTAQTKAVPVMANKPITEALEPSIDSSVLFHFNNGLSYYLASNNEKAISEWTKGLETSSNNSSLYYNRGIAKYNIQDFSGATNDWIKAKDLGCTYAEELISKYSDKIPKKLYYTPDPTDETGMHNYRRNPR